MSYPTSDIDIYTQYYLSQVGSGIGNIYSGPAYQKGYGIGSFLGGLFRAVFPLIKKGATALGSEVFKSGVGLFKDLPSTDGTTALKKHGKELVKNLSERAANQMFGGGYGYKSFTRNKTRQSCRKGSRSKKAKTASKRKNIRKKKTPRKSSKQRRYRTKAALQDIFS